MWRPVVQRIKSRLPFVRRREFALLANRHQELIEAFTRRPQSAASAQIASIKQGAQALHGDICFFVTHTASSQLKPHVAHHVAQLHAAGIQVVLLINTSLAKGQVTIAPELSTTCHSIWQRDNLGFDFAAWGHAFTLHAPEVSWQRLYLINDSVIGPLSLPDFSKLLDRIRNSTADVIGATENFRPVPHLQSFFLVLTAPALSNPSIQAWFRDIICLPTKSLVIDAYETRFRKLIDDLNLSREVLFPMRAEEKDRSLHDWRGLLREGFPFIKGSLLQQASSRQAVLEHIPESLR